MVHKNVSADRDPFSGEFCYGVLLSMYWTTAFETIRHIDGRTFGSVDSGCGIKPAWQRIKRVKESNVSSPVKMMNGVASDQTL